MTLKKLFFLLWPINRSLTGNGVQRSLLIIKKFIGKLKIISVPSGTKCFDWQVPMQWDVDDAYILDPQNNKICQFKKNNLHLVGFSHSVSKSLSLKKLKPRLHFIKKIPKAIPYITSYYKRSWGFCINYSNYKKLKNGNYKVFINSKIKKGKLSYGEYLKKGSDERQILFSCNICHPSLANNELSGPIVMASVAKWLQTISTKYTYRIIFIPETIGSLVFLKKNLNQLHNKLLFGYTITCIGDNKKFSFLADKNENSLVNRFTIDFFNKNKIKFKKYSWLDRGSDERQFCSPNIELPIASIMRSKYNTFREYHTSLDTYGNVVKQRYLTQSVNLIKKLIKSIEKITVPYTHIKGEPFMTKHKLYPTLSDKNQKNTIGNVMNILSYCNNKNMISDIVRLTKINNNKVKKELKNLKKKGIINY